MLTFTVTKPNTAPRTRHVPPPGLPGEPQDPRNPRTPQPCATGTPVQSQNSHASLRAALDKSAVAIFEDQAGTVCWHTVPQAHARLLSSRLASSSLPSAPCAHKYALCSCATPLDASLTYIPTCTPRRAAPVLCKHHFFCSLQQFSTVPADHVARCKKGRYQHVLKAQIKAQIFG